MSKAYRMSRPVLKIIVLALVSFLSVHVCLAQEWENPADKYKNAYKAYLDRTCPVESDNIQHFVYFSRDREKIVDHPFLTHPRFAGAQIMYSWKQLEPGMGNYDFSVVEEDLKYLEKHGKKLFVQLQDVTFYPKNKAVPNYLLSSEYDGGVVEQFSANGEPAGWVAKRWNENVRERFAQFLLAFGEAFDSKIEGINLQETAVSIEEDADPSFTEEGYVEALKANMLALKKAFPNATTMQYANFVPGEWRPWDDKGYLSGIYEYGEEIGVGLGSPDLMVTRKAQLNHPLGLMHEGEYSVPLGIAIQDGNYVGQTGADLDFEEGHKRGAQSRNNIVPLLHAFARDFLKVNYMFWVNQEPYFAADVLPCFASE